MSSLKKPRAKCINWFMNITEAERKQVVDDVSYMIIKYLFIGDSINLAKLKARKDLNYGFILVDHIARSSEIVKKAKAVKLKRSENEKRNY